MFAVIRGNAARPGESATLASGSKVFSGSQITARYVHPVLRHWILAFACLVAAVVGAAGQTPADLYRMEGTVRDAVTGQPVRKALISLTPAAGGEPIVAVTDSIGQ